MSKFIVSNKRESEYLLKEAREFLGLENVKKVEIYDVFESDSSLESVKEFFENATLHDDLAKFESDTSFRYRQILGQYDEVEEMAHRILNNLREQDVSLHHSNIISLVGASKSDIERFKKYFINNIECEVVPFTPLNFDMGKSSDKDLQPIKNFINFSEDELENLIKNYSMDLADIKVVHEYFKKEGRDPSIFELKVIDTYWSDHCRHTTFLTTLTEIKVEDGKYKEAIENSIKEYNEVRAKLNRIKPINLMDLATINARYAKSLGYLDNLDESDEVNACCVKIKVDVDSVEEDYLLYFKNETHNHPTEIEPFGGASTCVGGGIRDPLSGRSFVHQAMRITGAGDPTTPFDETRDGKLPQRFICQKAAIGYSDYANQIGQTSGYLREFYHPGFTAKRMEVGALVAAAPLKNVVRKRPENGDVVILLGGKTGRDGLGAAVGSSMVQTEGSLKLQGAEVQKGNPVVERKIIRLFRDKKATTLIKKCNDFGAGGVAVAIGELADGLDIWLEKVPTKYAGMCPSEIGLAESQERMAVVVSQSDAEKFIELAEAEDLEASIVAKVTDTKHMVMSYEGREVLRLSREFLDSNGGAKFAKTNVKIDSNVAEFFKENRDLKTQLCDLNLTSQSALAQNFDFTIGKNTILAPLGGKNRLTTQEGMVSKIPTLDGYTKKVSIMSSAYEPNLAVISPYHAGFYAVLNSVAKVVALGAKYQKARLSFQEFFERLTTDEKWGKPTSALLGAFSAMKGLNLAAIGGKDSMSGSFEELHVPPTLISFAVATTTVDNVVSRELKGENSNIYLLNLELNESDLVCLDAVKALFEKVTNLIEKGVVKAISTLDNKTIEMTLFEMAAGNGIGFELNKEYLGRKYPLGFIIETDEILDEKLIAKTNSNATAVLDETYSLDELIKAYVKPLSSVYNPVNLVKKADAKTPLKKVEIKSNAKVLIPVITGVNGEYDLYESFKEHTPNVEFFIIKEESDYKNSIKEFAKKLKEFDILAFPDGAILSNRLAYGQAVELILKDIKSEIEEFIKDKYILAIGASFAGFVRSGLIEFGEIKEGTSIKFRANPYEKFISEVVFANTLKESEFAGLGSYTTALAGYSLVVDLDEAKFAGQIISKYANFFDGEIGVDAMCDKSRHILGVNANFERFNKDGMKNIEVVEAPFIANLLKLSGK
ncbi:MAG: phosphoribosylformylglycinamidine synthase [Campylobacteraceae bacterium]|nr:phosphoribosylformylglycinamidine synthase [Campylobacteraceae bacterium]